MALLPKRIGNLERIDIALQPPVALLAGRVDMVVVDGAERNRELIAHLQTQSAGLRVANVVGLRGDAPADQARLTCHKAQMLLAADALRFADGENTLVDLVPGATAPP